MVFQLLSRDSRNWLLTTLFLIPFNGAKPSGIQCRSHAYFKKLYEFKFGSSGYWNDKVVVCEMMQRTAALHDPKRISILLINVTQSIHCAFYMIHHLCFHPPGFYRTTSFFQTV